MALLLLRTCHEACTFMRLVAVVFICTILTTPAFLYILGARPRLRESRDADICCPCVMARGRARQATFTSMSSIKVSKLKRMGHSLNAWAIACTAPWLSQQALSAAGSPCTKPLHY
eukprot:6172042-Pleurochrysis_carterae.AAC.1